MNCRLQGSVSKAVIFCLLALLGGCGMKTDLIPPSAVIPTAIDDLRFFQDESRVVLVWTYPALSTVGTDLPQIEAFQVFRAVVNEDDYCDTCPAPFSSLVEIPFVETIDGQKRQATYTERLLRPGHRYLYKVRTKAGWHLISDDSNTVSFGWESPAVAPVNLQVTVADSAVTLVWDKVVGLTDGTAIESPLKYQVYRAKENKAFVPVGPLTKATKYRDTGLLNDRSYTYKVRAVREKAEIKIFGLSSRVVEAFPLDQTAPIPPRGLQAVALTDGVKLLWSRNSERDLAGYRVYRRSERDLPWELRGEVGSGQHFFVDKIKVGQTFYYTVTAFDGAKVSNESLFAKELRYESF